MAAVLRAKGEVELLADVHGLVADYKGDTPFLSYVMAGKPRAIDRCARYLDDFFGPVQIKAVTKDMVEGFQDYLQGEAQADSTVDRRNRGSVALSKSGAHSGS